MIQLESLLDLVNAENTGSFSDVALLVAIEKLLQSRPVLETTPVFSLMVAIENSIHFPQCGCLELLALVQVVEVFEVVCLLGLISIVAELFKPLPLLIVTERRLQWSRIVHDFFSRFINPLVEIGT